MTHKLILPLALAAVVAAAPARETKEKSLQMKDLPAAVQKTVQDNLKGAEIKNIGKEKEDGVVQYEVETLLSGESRDFEVDVKGKLLGVEEATAIDAIPAAARAGILKRVGAGKLGQVEISTKPGQPALYEAAYTDKSGKHHEVLVKADGTPAKE